MTLQSETSSIRTMMTVVGLCAIGLTTTLNTDFKIYDDVSVFSFGTIRGNDIETTTPFPQIVEAKSLTNFDLAMDLFDDNMRDFTKEETQMYEASLKKIYKTTGVNIFDLC